jgi:hypothetical protein
MNQYDMRLYDKENPNTPPDIVKQITKETTDASDKFETFTVTHEPINLKAKLIIKKRTPVAKPNKHIEEEEEIIDEQYMDDDEDGLDL